MQKTRVPIDIITCPEWDAKPPAGDLVLCGKSTKTVIHHTAGHHRELDNRPAITTRAEAIRYAQDIQAFHMGPQRGWLDSGHNFLVLRDGPDGRDYAWILQGRWMTVSAIQDGRMVISAHAGSNDGNRQVGIEHEHNGTEPMTRLQREASARLHAWLSGQYRRTTIISAVPHSYYTNTSCPANLKSEIPNIRRRALEILKGV